MEVDGMLTNLVGVAALLGDVGDSQLLDHLLDVGDTRGQSLHGGHTRGQNLHVGQTTVQSLDLVIMELGLLGNKHVVLIVDLGLLLGSLPAEVLGVVRVANRLFNEGGAELAGLILQTGLGGGSRQKHDRVICIVGVDGGHRQVGAGHGASDLLGTVDKIHGLVGGGVIGVRTLKEKKKKHPVSDWAE